MLDYLVMDNCSPCSDVHMPDYLGVVADMFLGVSVCSHARLPSNEQLQSVLTCSCSITWDLCTGSGDLRILRDVNPDSFSQQAVVSDL